jgi:hypothetical protein
MVQNKMSNVEVTTGGKVILRRCVLSESVCHGINLLREATAIVEDCTIRGNKFHGTREPFFLFGWLPDSMLLLKLTLGFSGIRCVSSVLLCNDTRIFKNERCGMR